MIYLLKYNSHQDKNTFIKWHSLNVLTAKIHSSKIAKPLLKVNQNIPNNSSRIIKK